MDRQIVDFFLFCSRYNNSHTQCDLDYTYYCIDQDNDNYDYLTLYIQLSLLIGLHSMSSDVPQVRALLAALADRISLSQCSLSGQGTYCTTDDVDERLLRDAATLIQIMMIIIIILIFMYYTYSRNCRCSIWSLQYEF